MSEVPIVRDVAAELASAAATAPWVWILGDGAVPRPDTLERLLKARDVGDARGPAVLLSGLALGPGGTPVAAALPAGTEHDTAAVLALASHRVLPIRRAALVCALVRSDVVAAAGVPDSRFGRYAGQEWTARILRDAPGLLVPAAIVDLPAVARTRRSPGALAAAVRTARTQTWTNGEAIRAVWALVGP